MHFPHKTDITYTPFMVGIVDCGLKLVNHFDQMTESRTIDHIFHTICSLLEGGGYHVAHRGLVMAHCLVPQLAAL